jgi:hypothetical protein
MMSLLLFVVGGDYRLTQPVSFAPPRPLSLQKGALTSTRALASSLIQHIVWETGIEDSLLQISEAFTPVTSDLPDPPIGGKRDSRTHLPLPVFRHAFTAC